MASSIRATPLGHSRLATFTHAISKNQAHCTQEEPERGFNPLHQLLLQRMRSEGDAVIRMGYCFANRCPIIDNSDWALANITAISRATT